MIVTDVVKSVVHVEVGNFPSQQVGNGYSCAVPHAFLQVVCPPV